MKVITAYEVAERLQKSFKWVYENASTLGALRIGRSVIFTEEALEAALDAAREKMIEDSDRIKGIHSEPRAKPLLKKKLPFKSEFVNDPHGLMSKLH